MNINLYENKSGHNEHIYFIIKLYENKPGHYKHIYFNIKRCKNKSDIIVTLVMTGITGLLLCSHIYPLLAWSTP